jgi:hypothetical protein
MPETILLKAPDGITCEIARTARGFSPRRWRVHVDGGIYAPREPSAGLKAHVFSSARAAMMAAYRERRQQEEALRHLGH